SLEWSAEVTVGDVRAVGLGVHRLAGGAHQQLLDGDREAWGVDVLPEPAEDVGEVPAGGGVGQGHPGALHGGGELGRGDVSDRVGGEQAEEAAGSVGGLGRNPLEAGGDEAQVGLARGGAKLRYLAGGHLA